MPNVVAGFRQPEPQQRRGTMPSNGRLLSEATSLRANIHALWRAYASRTHTRNAPRRMRVEAEVTE